MKNKPTTYRKKTSEEGLGNPLALASLGVTALTAKTQVVGFTKKYWPYMLGAVGVGVGGYYVYKHFNNKNLNIKTDRSQAPTKLTKVEAQNIAETLFKAMDRPGTSESVIYDVLAGKTYNDFVMISDAFGERYYDKIFGVEGGWLFNKKYGLFEWLSFELTNSDMEKLRRIIPDVFKIEKKLRVGGTAYASKTFAAHKAKQIDGVWHRKEVDTTYTTGEKIGEIKFILDDPWQTNKQYAIVNKPWNWFWDLFIDVENIKL